MTLYQIEALSGVYGKKRELKEESKRRKRELEAPVQIQTNKRLAGKPLKIRPGYCRECGKAVAWAPTTNGKSVPMNFNRIKKVGDELKLTNTHGCRHRSLGNYRFANGMKGKTKRGAIYQTTLGAV